VARQQIWRPREGRSLSEKRVPGWIERKMLSILDIVPSWFLYAPLNLVFSGPGHIHWTRRDSIAKHWSSDTSYMTDC